ncbi:VanW family protein [Desulfotomaculum nigrificans CO-1-SRB]|uniref:VanW family protein n=1 Tax=Desulfotomaculum nigrificans (strain DSM 14880 / VKM B-2319 / CO-1-SRB) TaxID=868595 RepID=F6B9F9_DESCC|nr:VanW family protein [Desulfotomaculum nigrificans CO-1-SRB]
MLTLALGIQLLVSISLSSAALKFYYQGSVLPGLTVQGINIGGLKYHQAVEKLKQELPWPSPESLLVLVGPQGQTTNISYADIQYRPDYETTVTEALKQSSKIAAWANLNGLFRTINTGYEQPLRTKFNQAAFNSILNDLAVKYNQPARDAQLVVNGNNITIFQDIKGIQLDNQRTMLELARLPLNRHRLELKFKTVEPAVKAEDFKGINSRVAIFVTQFDPTKIDRTYNIKLASRLINNVLVKPGQIFSLDKTLGPRKPENGYRPAPVIVNNKLVPDYGGGVCQVATTLYNAVLLAGLTVIERSPHSMPVPYAPVGKDATIAGDLIDFKFLNSTPYPILITSQVHQGKLLVSIFGHREGAAARLIKIETERDIIKSASKYVEDTTLSPGQVVVRQPGRDGYTLKTYEVILENDKEISRRLISQNSVQPEPEVIAVGPKVRNKGAVAK